MRVLVTGSTGACGCAVVETLMREGYEVTGASRFEPSDRSYDWIRFDLNDPEPLTRRFRRFDAIVHLAHSKHDTADAMLDTDVAAVRTLAAFEGVFIFASSQTVYGAPIGEQFVETDGLRPETWYDLGKVVAERLVLSQSGPRVVFRLPLLYTANAARNYRQWLQIMYDLHREGRPFWFRDEYAYAHAGSSYLTGVGLGEAVSRALRRTIPGCFNLADGYATWQEMLRALDEHTGRETSYSIGSPQPLQSEIRLPQGVSRLETATFTGSYGPLAAGDWRAVLKHYIDAENAVNLR